MTKIQYCKNCKHLGHDGMFGLICDVNGDNTKYDCSKYEEDGDDGMTEKRFKNNGTLIFDNKTPLNTFEVVDKLNALHEENQSLKFQLDECRNNKLFSRRQLEKENEQLKQSYKEFEDECQSTFNAMSRKQNDLYRKNFKLKEENEQLKKAITTTDELLMNQWKENQRIKHTIKEAHYNERTAIGKSVLKQLMETIQ